MKKTCENCKFWKRYKQDESLGSCRRHAPNPNSGGDRDTCFHYVTFPLTRDYFWCGEYSLKINEVRQDDNYTSSTGLK